MMNNDLLIPRSVSQFFTRNSDMELLKIYINLDALTKESYSIDNYLDYKTEKEKPDFSQLTVIIPCWYEDNSQKIENLHVILLYLKFLGIQNIIISEYGQYSKYNTFINEWKGTFKNLNLIFTRIFEARNESIALNEAIKMCNTSYVAIMNNDMIVPKASFNKALSLLNSFDFVYASNNHYKQIANKFNLIKDFNFDNVDSEDYYNLDSSNLLFCKREYLLKIGGYNPKIEKDYSDLELLVRITMSDFTLFYVNDYSYYLGTEYCLSDKNLIILINQYNLAKLNDINLLINQNKNLYLNSILCRDDEFDSVSVSEYLLSVIVPVYNCEFFYIDRCMHSLKNQTLGFENIEVILVDDASSLPQSVNLINNYAKKYENVKVISFDVNSGAGMARNAGIKAASTKYITFLDHDDYFIKDTCEIIYDGFSKEPYTDVLITNFINFSKDVVNINDFSYLNINDYDTVINNYSDDLDIFSIPPITGTRSYSKEFLVKNHLYYSNYKFGENKLFNDLTLFKAHKIKIINKPAVVYDTQLSNSSIKNDKRKLFDFIGVLNECYKLYLMNNGDLIYNLNTCLEDLIENYFFKTKLTKDDIKVLVNETADLFSIFKENINLISKKHHNIFDLFISKNYDEVSEVYKKNFK